MKITTHGLLSAAGLRVYGTLACLVALSAPLAMAELRLGESPSVITLTDKEGGRVDGKPWSSTELQGKIHLLFYVDPDHKGDNEALETALNNEKFPEESFQSTAVINMDATWLPNAAIASSLKKKQEQYPRTVYVKDLKKKLVREWKIADNAYVVLMFDKAGKPLFQKAGTLSDADIKQLIGLIKSNL